MKIGDMKIPSLSIKQIAVSFLLTVLCTISLSFILFKHYSGKQDGYEVAIDVVHRNEELILKTEDYIERLSAGETDLFKKLKPITELYTQTLRVLKKGGPVPEMDNNPILFAAEENIVEILNKQEAQWLAYEMDILTLVHDLSETNKSLMLTPELLSAIKSNREEIQQNNNELVAQFQLNYQASRSEINTIILILTTLNIGILFLGYYLFKKNVIDKLNNLAQISEGATAGDLASIETDYKDESLKRISGSIKELTNVIDQSVQFAEKIGSGDFAFEFDMTSGSNRLFDELSNMKKKLRNVSEEDRKRKWATEGLASFAETLRVNQHNLKTLSDQLLVDLVKYLSANQGAIFLTNGNNGEEYLELVSSYAWERKKFLMQKVEKGDGLVGECWIEGEMIYMTDVPEDFIKITSGLGKANPNAVVIAPLKVNGAILGVLELASFKEFENYQLEFIAKLTENIAATIANVKASQETKVLLEVSQEHTEKLRAQEEEMQQNMEELTATQETMLRKEKELTGLLEASMNNVKQNLNEIAVRIQSSIASGKKELKFLSHVPPIEGMIRALENDGVDPMDNSTYETWLERFVVILDYLLDAKEIYHSVQCIYHDRQVCSVVFENGKTVIERDQVISDEGFLNQLESVKEGEVYVFAPQKKKDSFTLRICTPIYHAGEYYGSLIIDLLGDEIMETISAKEDLEHSYILTSSDGHTLFKNPAYDKKSDLKTTITINKEKGYSFEIMNTTRNSTEMARVEEENINIESSQTEPILEPILMQA